MISPRAIASICCSPPESVPASCVRRSARRGKTLVHRIDGVVDLRALQPGHRAGEAQGLLDAEVREDAATLGDVDDALAGDLLRRPALERAAVELDVAREQRQHPRQRAQRRRLAGAVRAEQGDDLALAHLEVDVEHDRQPAVPGADPAGLEQRVAHAAAAVPPPR